MAVSKRTRACFVAVRVEKCPVPTTFARELLDREARNDG